VESDATVQGVALAAPGLGARGGCDSDLVSMGALPQAAPASTPIIVVIDARGHAVRSAMGGETAQPQRPSYGTASTPG